MTSPPRTTAERAAALRPGVHGLRWLLIFGILFLLLLLLHWPALNLPDSADEARLFVPAAHDLQSAGVRAPRPSAPAPLVFVFVLLAQVGALSIAGGAMEARALLPVTPLVILVCVSTVWRRVRYWQFAFVAICAALALGNFAAPSNNSLESGVRNPESEESRSEGETYDRFDSGLTSLLTPDSFDELCPTSFFSH